ncbi:MAG: hypothetical protein ACKV0T_12870 [Planctomycetales bacterium]
MPALIELRLAELRRRLRQTLWTNGLSWLATVAIGATLAACLADWLIHLDDPGVRLLLELGVVALAGWVAYRRLVSPLRVPLSNIDLALRVEDRFPGFRDSLASAVQFVEGAGDPRVGSPALQQVVVRDTLARLEGLDCNSVLNPRAARRIAAVALGVCLAAALIAAIGQENTAIALRRLFLPFAAPAWPRHTQLRLLNADLRPLEQEDIPLQIVRGETLKLFAENTAGRLPGRVVLESKGADGKVQSEPMRPLTVGGEAEGTREVAVGQLSGVKGEIQFRAVGGDDNAMPWRRLQVIPPPVVESLRVTLTPPTYARRPVEQLPEGVGHIQALVGTRVEIAATLNKPLQSARVRVRDQQRRAARVTNDGLKLSASFVIESPGNYAWWLDLKDRQGFENADPPRYEIRAVADAEPEVRIDLPVADMQVTADAEVAIQAVARDDLGLSQIRLAYRRDAAETQPAEFLSLFDGEARPLEQPVELGWKLAELNLVPGARIVFHVEATDDFDLRELYPDGKAPPPHVGRSTPRTLTVVTAAEKTQELAQRQGALFDDLQRAFKQQQQARQQVGELQLQWENAGKLRTEDFDTLQRTEIRQREVAGQLGHPTSGLARRAQDLLEELRGNRLDDPQSERRLEEMASELQRLTNEKMPLIESELTQARKLSQTAPPAPRSTASPPTAPADKPDRPSRSPDQPADKSSAQSADSEDDPSSADETQAAKAPPRRPATPTGRQGASRRPERALSQAAQEQQAVLDSLEEMLRDLAQWRSQSDAARDLAELINQQDKLNTRTAELARETLTRSGEALTGQQKADQAKVADMQKKQAELFEQFRGKVEDRARELSGDQAELSGALRDTADQARDQGVAEQMREAAGQIGDNLMGAATRSQEEVLKKLRDLEQTLGEAQQDDTETLVKKLKQSEEELQALRDGQSDLLRKFDEARQIPDAAEREAELQRLSREQQKLQEEAQKQARSLQRLQARRASAAAQRAASRMRQVQEEMDRASPESAAQEQQEALDDLEQAQRELARQRRTAEEQLAREELDRIASELAAMIGREAGALEESRRLEALRLVQGKFTRSQLLALGDLTAVQRALQEDTDRLVEKLTAAEVFAQALRGASQRMHQAVERLEARETGEETQQLQDQALRRLVALTESLKPDENEPDSPQQEQEGGGGGGEPPEGEGPQTDGIPQIAQLKLLLAMQRELLERTARWRELRSRGKASATDEQKELEALAREQSELADLARNLSHLAAEPNEPDSDSDEPERTDRSPTDSSPSPQDSGDER